MLVIIDANVVVKDPLLRERKWDAARAAIEATRLRLILPEIARLEAIGGYRRDQQKKISDVQKILRKSTGAARTAARALLDVYAVKLTGTNQS
jgi:predicted nucleic acid-binding protein